MELQYVCSGNYELDGDGILLSGSFHETIKEVRVTSKNKFDDDQPDPPVCPICQSDMRSVRGIFDD
jgi:hypothetical protein